MTTAAIALVRMLQRSIADDATCTCSPGICPECEAMAALGLGQWYSARHAELALAGLGKPAAPPVSTPSAGDRLAVGSTLRALAANGTPNADTAETLERVGVWLVEGALTEIAATKGGKVA